MTHNPASRLPVPVEVTGLSFLKNADVPKYVVLEFQTTANPIRLFLTKAQTGLLASLAKTAATQIQG